MKRGLIAAAILAAVLLVGFFAYRHFVTDRVMDKGGMENPDASIEILDGPGEIFDGGEDLRTTWYSDESSDYTVEIGDGVLTLYEGETPVCKNTMP